MTTFEKVRATIIEKLGDLTEEEVTLEASIMDDLGADSLDVVEIMLRLEEEFQVDLPNDEVETIRTVGEVVDFIQKKLDVKNG